MSVPATAPLPAKPYSESELARLFKAARLKKGIVDRTKMRVAVNKKVNLWLRSSTEHERISASCNLTTELLKTQMTWKVFCKGASVLNLEVDDILVA
jgi:hypothetical protein